MDLKKIVENHLKAWPLYESSTHEVVVRDCGSYIWIGYRRRAWNRIQEYNAFDINIIESTFFILEIYLELQNRGKGHGHSLYKVLEMIAKDVGCSKVQMMPSGWTSTGESRKNYLLRRGYREIGNEVVKEV